MVVEAEVAVAVAEVVTVVVVAEAATALAPTLTVAVAVATLAGGKQFDRFFALRTYRVSFFGATTGLTHLFHNLGFFSFFLMDTEIKQCCTSASLTDSGGIDRVHIEHAILCYIMIK